MRRLLIKFPNQIRISGWDFGSSARAMNQAGGKISTQADSRTVRKSTTERKIMSTKTSIKRIALVVASVVGFGLVPSITASAAPQSGAYTVLYNYGPSSDNPSKPAITISADAGSNKGILVIKDEFYSTVAGDKDTITVTAVTNVRNAAGALNPTFPIWDAWNNKVNSNGAVSVSGDTSVASLTSIAAGIASGEGVLKFQPSYAGTYVFRITATSGWSYDWTVIAAAQDLNPVAAKSTSVMAAGAAAAPAVAGTDDVVTAPKAAVVAAGGEAANILVTSKTTAGADVTGSTVLTATISGPGLLAIGSNRATMVPQGRAVTGAAGQNIVGVFSDGTAGTATVSIYAGSTLLSTETVGFFGAPTSITATANRPVITYLTANVKWFDGNNITAVLKDANGIVVAGAGVTITVPAGSTVCGSWGGGVYGLSAGTCVATVTSNDVATLSTTVTTQIVGSPLTATVAFDKDSYYLGEKMKITVTYRDAAGNLAGAGQVNTAVGSAISLTTDRGTIGGTVINATGTNDDATLGGVATQTDLAALTYSGATAPLVAGKVTLSFTDLAGNVVTASAPVEADKSVVSDAVDAATEATDAANAATDAANAAAEAADAATAAAQDAQAAVQELATQVAALIAEIKDQITALTNLVIKIQKKVKA